MTHRLVSKAERLAPKLHPEGRPGTLARVATARRANLLGRAAIGRAAPGSARRGREKAAPDVEVRARAKAARIPMQGPAPRKQVLVGSPPKVAGQPVVPAVVRTRERAGHLKRAELLEREETRTLGLGEAG